MDEIIKRQSKYNVNIKDKEKRSHNGIVFDSILEMKYYRDVVLPQVESGDIVYYELQKRYELQPKFTHEGKTVQPINYVADFFIRYKDGTEEVIDTKGNPDSVAKIKRKLFWYKFPDLRYLWICYSKKDGGWVTFEVVKKGRAQRKKLKKLKQDKEG